MDAEADAQALQNPRVAGEDINKEARPEVGVPIAVPPTPQGRAARSAGGSLSAPPRRRSRTPGKAMSKGPDSADRQVKSAKGNEASSQCLETKQ